MTAAPPGPEASAWLGSEGVGNRPTDEERTSPVGFQPPAALVVCRDRDLQSWWRMDCVMFGCGSVCAESTSSAHRFAKTLSC